jgi:hypothetical protein
MVPLLTVVIMLLDVEAVALMLRVEDVTLQAPSARLPAIAVAQSTRVRTEPIISVLIIFFIIFRLSAVAAIIL